MTTNIRVTKVKNKIIITDDFYYQAEDNVLPIYIGSGPHYIITHMLNFHGRALDIGTGSGIFAIFAADKTHKVIATDINDRGLLFTRFNSLINSCKNKIEIRKGSLWQPVKNEKFDYIISNPPFVASPPGARGAIHSLGGIDGLKFTRKIIKDLPKYLTRKGKAQIYTLSFGWGNYTMVEDIIKNFLSKHKIKATIINFYSKPLPIEIFTHQFVKAKNYKKWVGYLSKLQLDTLHALIINFEPSKRFGIKYEQIPKKERKNFPDNWGIDPNAPEKEKKLHWKKRFTYWIKK